MTWSRQTAGPIAATVRGEGRRRLTLRTSNLAVDAPEQATELASGRPQTVQWTACIIATNEPWVAVVVPDGNVSARREVSRGAAR